MTAILLGHGGGGLLTRKLIEDEIVSRFGTGPLAGLPDGATLDVPAGKLVFSTDGFVVSPLQFPGGNIGHLAVHGTVNDVAVCGARPLWISLALILEEGLPLEVLRTVLDTVRDAARDCGVQVVTGDTKVVRRGQCDGMYITTAGLGVALPGFSLSPARIAEGDHVLVSGALGDHGLAVMAAREGLGAGAVRSDTGSVHRLVAALEPFAEHVRFLRDPTRGGVAATLTEVAQDAGCEVLLRERDLPVSEAARGLAEMLGFDVLHLANEGRVLCVCAPEVSDAVCAAWRALPEGAGAARIGEVTAKRAGRVLLETAIGGRRVVDVPQGELLPRIC